MKLERFIRPGDWLAAVNGIDLSKKSFAEAMDILRIESDKAPYRVRFGRELSDYGGRWIDGSLAFQ